MNAGWNVHGFLIVPREIEARQSNPAVWNNRSSVKLSNVGPNNPNSVRSSSVALSHVPSNLNHASLNAGMIIMVAEEMAITEEVMVAEEDN